jgi:FtsH-binding integral membrane protein
MLDWQKWKYENRDKIKHIVGYEEKFVDEILSQMPEISPMMLSLSIHLKIINLVIGILIS